ncbi:unnamed protein product [Boreogadus saida]
MWGRVMFMLSKKLLQQGLNQQHGQRTPKMKAHEAKALLVLFASRTQIRHGPFAQPTPPTSRRSHEQWRRGVTSPLYRSSPWCCCVGAGLGSSDLFCGIKRRRASIASDKNQSTHECPGEPRRNSLLPASLTNPHPDSTIYSNGSGFPKPQDQPDESVSVPSSPEQPGVFYSTVSYNNDSKGVALKTDTDSVMYSTIQKTQ